ncbi:hypothetical protein P7K49_002553 [Saguinus oedipus]|uniref:Coiled-coil domain-containing protein 116 n=1 Tax=Saguinus oedipus TaxID=9490 RepID=A0ABQ9WHM5_SAGOE|nr:hypothetical protein P7K49_002553 [Saguinus oedipus]
MQSPSSSRFTKKKPLPSISSKSSMSHFSNRSYEELIDFLTQQAASLIIRKYEFEKDLNKQLGFFSFPVTQVLRDLSLGLKKVKGSHIHQSSETHLSCLLRKLEEAKRARQDFSLSTSYRSPEMPSVQQELATHTVQDQTTEPCHSLYTDLPASQQLSPLEPRLSGSAHTGTGSSPSRSKDMDSEGHDKVELEDEDEDEDEYEDEEQDEDRDEGGVQSLPEPGEEASVSHPMDLGHIQDQGRREYVPASPRILSGCPGTERPLGSASGLTAPPHLPPLGYLATLPWTLIGKSSEAWTNQNPPRSLVPARLLLSRAGGGPSAR